MNTPTPNGPRQTAPSAPAVPQGTPYPRATPAADPPRAAKQKRPRSSQYPYECHVSFSIQAGEALQRLARRRGMRMSETLHVRHAVDHYLAAADPVFRAWLEGGNG